MKEIMLWIGINLFFLIVSIILVVGIVIYIEIFKRAYKFCNEEEESESESKDERYDYK